MLQMQISKQTEDKVKLAKKYIEDKYKDLLMQERQQKQNWNKIVTMMTKNKLIDTQKQKIQNHFKSQQQLKKRLMRQKDSLKNYQLYELIGRGAFGQVRLARNKISNEVVAIKRMEKKKLIQKKQISSAYVEKQLMIKNLDSKFLVKLHSTFQDRNYLYIVMNYVPGGDLLHLLIEKDIFTEQQTRFYIAQLIVAIQQMHQRNFIHRDIKPDNILIDRQGHIKISDFGLSKYVPQQNQPVRQQRTSVKSKQNKTQKNYKTFKKQHQCLQKLSLIRERDRRTYSKVGTPDYISPEVLTADQYDFSIDIWSVGVIMFECLFGYPPFSHEDPKQVCQRVVNWVHNLQFPEDITVSLEAKLLILGMINERGKRLSIKQIKDHPFFQGIKWDKILSYRPPMIPKLQGQYDTKNFQKYEEQNLWTFDDEYQSEEESHNDCINEDQKQRLSMKRLFCKKRSSSIDCVSAQYSFAGFEYQNVSIQPFKTVQNYINKLNQQRQSKVSEQKHKWVKNSDILKKSIRRFHTEEQSSEKIKKKPKAGSQKYLIKMPKCSNAYTGKIVNQNYTATSFVQSNQTVLVKNDWSHLKQPQINGIKKTTQFSSTRKIPTPSRIPSKKVI